MKKPLQPHLLKRVPPACKGGEDHEVAREAADWRSGPRWSILSVLCPVHPFATTWHFPSRGNKKFEEKNRESYTSCTTPAFPLWWLAPPPCPVGSMSLDSRVAGLPYESSSFATPTSWGHYKAPLCCELLMKGLLFRALFCPACGGSPAKPDRGEASAASQLPECLSCHMMQKANPVTLTL